jgi:single-strand DNA-binding protein
LQQTGEIEMTESISTTGLVATVPRHVVTSEGLPITSFRLAATQRRYNRSTQAWENGETNWFTVTAFRQLALNLAGSLEKGDRVVVGGRLKIRDWENGDRGGTIVEIDATVVGHDLNWGTSVYTRAVRVESLNTTPGDESASEHESAESGAAFDPDEAASVSDGEQTSLASDWSASA